MLEIQVHEYEMLKWYTRIFLAIWDILFTHTGEINQVMLVMLQLLHCIFHIDPCIKSWLPYQTSALSAQGLIWVKHWCKGWCGTMQCHNILISYLNHYKKLEKTISSHIWMQFLYLKTNYLIYYQNITLYTNAATVDHMLTLIIDEVDDRPITNHKTRAVIGWQLPALLLEQKHPYHL